MAGILVPECMSEKFVTAFLAVPIVPTILITISSAALFGKLPVRLSRLVTLSASVRGFVLNYPPLVMHSF